MADLQAKDVKLIQYLNEAYGTEKRLETALQAHIEMTTRAPYKKRLQQHLKETKAHARAVGRRIKQLGGKAETVSVPGPDAVGEAAKAALTGVQKAAAAAQGPLHMARGTGEQERLLRNARTELQNESEEIGTYSTIATLAELVGDKETAKLAKGIMREEQRMSDFLQKLIPQLTKAVAQEELPAAERRGGRTTRRRTASRSRSSSSSSSPSSRSSSRGGSGGRKTASRSSGSRSSSSRSGSGRSGSSRSSSTRSGSSRSSSARSGSSSRSRSSGGSSTRRKSSGSSRSASSRRKS